MATSTGKIGRLPDALREEINGMIRDNCSAEQIITRLEVAGVKGVTAANVSAWKKYGYSKWEARQERLRDMEARRDFAMDLVREAKASGDEGMTLASDAASAMAIDHIMGVLEQFDASQFSAMLAEKPERFVDLVMALTALRKRDQDGVLLQQKVDEYRRKIKQLADVVDERGVATKDDVQQIFAEAYQT